MDLFQTYWPHILAALSLVMGSLAAIHATMNKREVRSAIGWVGVILLSPILGALIYAVVGVNRIRRKSILSRRTKRGDAVWGDLSHFRVEQADYERQFGSRQGSLKRLSDKVTGHPLVSGNTIDMLSTGDEAYAALADAFDKAERSILLETYIFDRDHVGLKLADCLIAARKRGVEVRVLIDAVGARYSVPSIVSYLQDGGVTVEVFNGQVIAGLRLPYANLRTHRKIAVVDGALAFMGGMNIRAAFSGPDAARDTHFKITGPIVADLFAVAADDWQFETGEDLSGDAWALPRDHAHVGAPLFARAVVSGPDANIERNHKVMMGAFSVAEKSIRIMSPYFLPDSVLLAALSTAARRGVTVEIVVPGKNNLAIVARAMTAQFDVILKDGARIFKGAGVFDHSKLMVVDGRWSFVGSSNIDSRSLRLNFEVDLEVHDDEFGRRMDERIIRVRDGAEEVTLQGLRSRAFPMRLLDRILWLASPYI